MLSARLTAVVCLAAALPLIGCGTLSNARKIDYRSARAVPSLEVPPDLTTTLNANAASGSATYSKYAGAKQSQAPQNDSVLPEFSNVKLMRDGQTRYVLVQAEPGTVWNEVIDFLTKTGLSIAHEDAKAGLIETGWAENHALVEKGFLSKWLKSSYASGTRDKYRVRLERGATPGTTEVYLTHEGLEEVTPDPNGGATPGWRPRPPDPELETEMLHRLLVYLGGDNTVRTATAPATRTPPESTPPAEASSPASPPSARLTRTGNGTALLTLEDSLERAWRRVGLSLDRIGFTVEDRDRSRGIYYVRYIDPDTQAKTKGFFSRLFSGGDKAKPSNEYQVHVRPGENGTNVEVLDKEGDPEASKTGERILSLLYEQLK